MQIQIIRAKSGGTVQYRNVFHAGWCILRGYGIRGVYQGLGATLMRDTPAFGIYFGRCFTDFPSVHVNHTYELNNCLLRHKFVSCELCSGNSTAH